MVDVGIIRKAVDESNVSYYDLANRLGWMTNCGTRSMGTYQCPDSQRVKRILGVTTYHDGYGGWVYRRKMSDKTASRILYAIDKMPVEVGL
jgi:hypothetical protein